MITWTTVYYCGCSLWQKTLLNILVWKKFWPKIFSQNISSSLSQFSQNILAKIFLPKFFGSLSDINKKIFWPKISCQNFLGVFHSLVKIFWPKISCQNSGYGHEKGQRKGQGIFEFEEFCQLLFFLKFHQANVCLHFLWNFFSIKIRLILVKYVFKHDFMVY